MRNLHKGAILPQRSQAQQFSFPASTRKGPQKKLFSSAQHQGACRLQHHSVGCLHDNAFRPDPGRGPDGSIPGADAPRHGRRRSGQARRRRPGCLLMLPRLGEARWNRWRCGPRRMREGRFRLTTPPLQGLDVHVRRVWAYRPGSGDHGRAESTDRRRPWSCASRSRGPSRSKGLTVSPSRGARVSPRVLFVRGGGDPADMPDIVGRAAGGHDRAGRQGDARLPGGRGPTGRRASHGRIDRHARLPAHRTAAAATARRRRSPSGSSRRAGWPAGSELVRASRSRARRSRSGSRGAPGWNRIRSGSRTGRCARPPTARSRRPTTCWSARPIGSWFGAGDGADPVGLDHDRRASRGSCCP